MNRYLKSILISILIIIVFVIVYYLIISDYPYDPEDLTETYYNTILILKGILICGSIITISIVLTTATQNNKRR